MANETSREMSVLEISGADDTSTNIKLKIIDSITFVDPSENYQESVYRFENNASANRDVEIAEVGKDAPKLKVERIRKLNIFSPEEQGQEFFYELLTAPGAHRSTHTVKIYRWDEDRKEKDTSTWVKVERVDEIGFVDPANQYQETVYSLNWPDVDNEDWDYQGLSPIIRSDPGSGINPPWRLDPFQNIVDASFGRLEFGIAFVNGNNITDDNFRLFINGKFVMTLDFAYNNEATAYFAHSGDRSSFIEALKAANVFDSGWTIRGSVKYASFEKSAFRYGSNSIYMENIADNGYGTLGDIYFVMYSKKDPSDQFAAQGAYYSNVGESLTRVFTIPQGKPDWASASPLIDVPL